MVNVAPYRPGVLAGNIGRPSLLESRPICLFLALWIALTGCSPPSQCEQTVELVRKCRLNSGIETTGNLDEQVAMCEAARQTWPDVQDEIDCAVEAAGKCPEYRSCERRVQRQRLIDEAMRRQSQGSWKPTGGWCSIFDEHRATHPELADLCPPIQKNTDENKEVPERQSVAPSRVSEEPGL